MDVAEMFRECEVNKDCGFHIQAEIVSGKKGKFVIHAVYDDVETDLPLKIKSL